MKAKRTILFFLLLSALIPSAYAADFGEDEDYLGQIVDDYINADNVNFSSGVIHNGTLDCIELNYSSSVVTPENMTTYTEQDEGNGIAVVNDTYVDMVISRNQNRYIYFDFGVDGLQDYKIFAHFRLDYAQAGSWGGYCMMSNYLGNEQQHRDNTEDYTGWHVGGTYGKLGLREYESGNFYGDGDVWDIPLDTFYWIKMEKVGVMLYLDVYSTEALRDAEGNGDMEDLELTLHVDHSFRYFYLGNSHDDGNSFNQNLELYLVTFMGDISGYEASGYYTTVDMLGGDRGLALMYNGTIPAGCGMTMQFWNGSAWVNHNNMPGHETLTAGYEAIDTRDIYPIVCPVRVNMTSDGSDTPRMYQLRWVTVTTIIVGGGLFPGLAIGIAILIIAYAYLATRR